MAITGFWSKFSFVGNVSKMRKALVEYLTDEGIKCDLCRDARLVRPLNL